MSWSTEFESMFPDGVSVKGVASVSTDGYGTEVWGTASTYKARYVREQKLVRTFAGTEELSQATVWIASTSTFEPSIQLTVNGSTLGPLMALEAYPDDDGIHHVKAFLG